MSIFDLVKETMLYKSAMALSPEEDREKVEMYAKLVSMKFDSVVDGLQEVVDDPEKKASMRNELLRMARDPKARAESTDQED